jgi:hypothetical protein
MPLKNVFKTLIPFWLREKIWQQFAATRIINLSGPQKISIAKDEAVVTCVVKNGEFYIESFIEHYSQMGFRHIFFLDNGSNDQTIELAKVKNNVSVFRCDLSINKYQRLFKRYLAKNTAIGGWRLDADIDEFFNYPFSDSITFQDFLGYLNRENYSAVVTQLLDMFSDSPVGRSDQEGPETSFKEVYQYFDISNIEKEPYCTSKLGAKYGHKNTIANPDTALIFGGIRKSLYGNNCLLTKHSLFLPEKGLDLFPHVHFVNRARLADISCIMHHYKLTSNVLDIAQQNKEGFSANSAGYNDFIKFLVQNNGLDIKTNSAAKFKSVDDLVRCGFLFSSDRYRGYIDQKLHAVPADEAQRRDRAM